MIKKAFLVLCCAMTTSCAARAPIIDHCFTPGGSCMATVVAEIAKARTEILVQAHSLNAKQIADALVTAKGSGVAVEILLDKGSTAAQNNAAYFATLNNVPTYLDGQHGASDNNVIIIDKGTVIASSSTFERTDADRYAENMLFVRSEAMATRYRTNWEEHRAHAEVYSGTAEASVEPPKQEPSTEKAEKKSARKPGKAKRKVRIGPSH